MNSKTQFIFLCYVNRSGSTMLSYQLSRHPDICVCPEAEVLVNLLLRNPRSQVTLKTINAINKALLYDFKLKLWNVDELILRDFVDSTNYDLFKYVLTLYKDREKPKAHFILFKEQNLIRFMTRFGKYYQVSSVVLIRDPRAILYSQMNTIIPETEKPFSNNCVTTLLYCKRFFLKVAKLKKNKDIYILRYEDLVNDFQLAVESLFFSIGLKFCHFQNEGNFAVVHPLHFKIHSNAHVRISNEYTHKWGNGLLEYHRTAANCILRNELQMFGYTSEARGRIKLNEVMLLAYDYLRWVFYVLNAKVKWLVNY